MLLDSAAEPRAPVTSAGHERQSRAPVTSAGDLWMSGLHALLHRHKLKRWELFVESHVSAPMANDRTRGEFAVSPWRILRFNTFQPSSDRLQRACSQFCSSTATRVLSLHELRKSSAFLQEPHPTPVHSDFMHINDGLFQTQTQTYLFAQDCRKSRGLLI